MKALVLLNGGAGTLEGLPVDEEAVRLRERFLEAGVAARVRVVRPEKLGETAARGVAEEMDAIVAGGGDGTVSSVAAALAGSSVPFGVLPLGTLNHFAKDLGLPADMDEAVRVIARCKTQLVDVGQVNGRTFVNNSSIGTYPLAVRERDERRKRFGHGKWRAMLSASLRALRRHPMLRVRISMEGQELVRETPFVFVGNNRYEMSLMSFGGRTSLSRGELSVYLANRTGRLGMVRLAARAMFGRLSQAKDFEAMWMPELWIETRRRRLHVALDGELHWMTPPLHYQVMPGALRAIVP